jgi:hypothetical protein
MLMVAEDVKQQIETKDQQRYSQYLTDRLKVLRQGIEGNTLSAETQKVKLVRTRELPLVTSVATEYPSAHLASEFVTFAIALGSGDDPSSQEGMKPDPRDILKDSQFTEKQQERVINALENIAKNLERAYPELENTAKSLERAYPELGQKGKRTV